MKRAQQLRKKYHRRLVERSKKPGHPTIGQPGSTQRYKQAKEALK